MLKSLGLFFLIFGMIAGLGALVQIDPIWVYGPNDPAAILPGAQPDWYLGWIEGAMRLFPGVNLRLGHWLVPELFFPAVLFPGLIFVLLYVWPWIDKLIFFDFREHHVLRLPWQQPFNTALGCSLIMMVLVLLFAGGDDVIAIATDTSVVDTRVLLRILFFIAPAVTWVITYALCRWKLHRHLHTAKLAAAQEEHV
jgi:ubiquinol-cytochrome c reductase cytochrome b subunit